jgi:hypothetical protein
VVGEGNRQPRQEAEVVWETLDQWMPVVQVKVQRLADPAE